MCPILGLDDHFPRYCDIHQYQQHLEEIVDIVGDLAASVEDPLGLEVAQSTVDELHHLVTGRIHIQWSVSGRFFATAARISEMALRTCGKTMETIVSLKRGRVPDELRY